MKDHNYIKPMKHFTPETFSPNERTLEVIKQIAYTYRVIKLSDGNTIPYCLN